MSPLVPFMPASMQWGVRFAAWGTTWLNAPPIRDPGLGEDGTALCCAVGRVDVGPAIPSFRALSGRLQSTVRRHQLNKDSLSVRLKGNL